MPLTPGTLLGPYEIVELIGEGGMGAVYKARDPRLGREVAVKIIAAEKMEDPDRKRRFVHEARAASALNHPHIVTIHDVGETGGVDYIVMEYVAGRTLTQLIPREGMKPAEALKYAIPVADALARAHAAGIVHRDLKPANVIVSREDAVKVLDFGLAKHALSGSAGEMTRTMGDESQPGIIVGTAAYMSPEQAEARPVDARADIFSFGALLYEMLTGRRAFTGKTTISTLAAVLHQDPKPPRELAPQTPPELERIVRRCLRKEPERRFQSAADLKVALQEVQEDLQSGQLEAPLATLSTYRGAKRTTAAMLVAALLLGALAAWLALRRAAPQFREFTFRRLTNDSGLTRSPAISRDGKLVAYESDRGGTGITDIWLQQVAGGPAIRLTNCRANCMQPAFSPDGSSLLYFSREGGGAVYQIATLGGEPRRIVSPVVSYGGAAPQYSPDGSKIAFSVTDWRSSGIDVVDPAGATLQKIRGPEILGGTGFAWTPDSRGILTVAFGDGRPDCWIYSVNGGPRVPTGLGSEIARFTGTRRSGSIESLAGGHLLVSVSDSFRTSLLDVPVSPSGKPTGSPRWLTKGSGTESEASLSSDGSRIAFASYTASSIGIWRIPMEVAAGRSTGPAVQLTQSPASYVMPAPAAHAPVLAYVSQDSIAAVFVRDVASGRQRRVAERGMWPLLSSDGRKLAFMGLPDRRSEIGRGPLFLAALEGESVRKICDMCGEPYHFYARDSKLLFDHADPKSHEIKSLNISSGEVHLILQHSKNAIFVPHLSPDEKWALRRNPTAYPKGQLSR